MRDSQNLDLDFDLDLDLDHRAAWTRTKTKSKTRFERCRRLARRHPDRRLHVPAGVEVARAHRQDSLDAHLEEDLEARLTRPRRTHAAERELAQDLVARGLPVVPLEHADDELALAVDGARGRHRLRVRDRRVARE